MFGVDHLVQLFVRLLSELQIAVTELISTTPVLRNYNSTFVATLRIHNMNDTLSVAHLDGTRTNFDMQLFLLTAVNSDDRLDFTLISLPLDENQLGLPSGKKRSITVEFMAYVPKEVCQTFTELCIEVNPSQQSSYSSPATFIGNRLCHDATKYVLCFGEY